MIELKNVDKKFRDIQAADHITASVREGMIFGLVGSNGAGKSTLLRMICGVIKPDSGEVLADGAPVYENPDVKSQICFLSDSPYYFANADIEEMRDYYMTLYPSFDRKLFDSLVKKFGLEPKRKISSFSKGMKKQVSILLGLCAKTKYLLCDETFDGLDPVVRDEILDTFLAFVCDEDHAVLMSSHITSDLEKAADYIAYLHRGQLLLFEEKDSLLERYGRLVCGAADLERVDGALLAGVRRGQFSCEALVRDRESFSRSYPRLQVERVSLDDIMVFMNRRDKA